MQMNTSNPNHKEQEIAKHMILFKEPLPPHQLRERGSTDRGRERERENARAEKTAYQFKRDYHFPSKAMSINDMY